RASAARWASRAEAPLRRRGARCERGRRRGGGPPGWMRANSSRHPGRIPVGRPLDLTEHLNLWLEGNSESLTDPATALRHQREDAGELAAVGVGVHPNRPANGARDVDCKLEALEAPTRRLRGRGRHPRPAAAEQPPAVALDRAELTVQLQDKPGKATIRYEEVR